MCETKILNTSEFGQISFCQNCESVQIDFGRLIYNFNYVEFDQFRKYINHLYKTHYHKLLLNGGKIYSSSANNKMILAFNTDDLRGLWELINETSILIEANKLLRFSN